MRYLDIYSLNVSLQKVFGADYLNDLDRIEEWKPDCRNGLAGDKYEAGYWSMGNNCISVQHDGVLYLESKEQS